MRRPSLHENEVFEGLCAAAATEAEAQLGAAVKQHLRELEPAARQNELLATDLAEELAQKLDALLAGLDALPADARPLVVGAVTDDSPGYHFSERLASPLPPIPPILPSPAPSKTSKKKAARA